MRPAGRDCPNCGATGVFTGREKVCAQCGIDFSTDDDAAADDRERRDDLLTTLTALAPPSGRSASIRSATANLARSLEAAGRFDEAARLYETALAAKGRTPSAADLHAGRARSLLSVEAADPSTALPDVLAVVAGKPGPSADVLRAAAAALTPTSARRVRATVDDAWIDRLEAAGPMAAEACILAAAGQAVGERRVRMVGFLERARGFDRTTARAAWSAWVASPAGRAALESGSLARVDSLLLQARARIALHEPAAARVLLDTVIDGRLSERGYPEWEAYQLRAGLLTAEPQARAADLIAAAMRLGWRNTRADALRAKRLLRDARRLDPRNLDAVWNLVEIMRLLAYLEPSRDRPPGADVQPDLDLLRDAEKEWRRGATRGPTSAWSQVVLAQVLNGMAGAMSADPEVHAVRARFLDAALGAVRLDPSWAPGWAVAAQAARSLRMWHASAWLTDRLVATTGDWTGDDAAEASAAMEILVNIDPPVAAARIDDYERRFPDDEAWSSLLRAVLAALDLCPLEPLLARLERPWSDGLAGVAFRLWIARALWFTGDPRWESIARAAVAAVEASADVYALMPVEPAMMKLWLGDRAGADAAFTRALEHRDSADPDPVDLATFALHTAVLDADEPAAERALATLVGRLTRSESGLLERELRAAARNLRTDGGEPDPRATRADTFADTIAASACTPGLGAATATGALREVDEIILTTGREDHATQPLSSWRAYLSERVRPSMAAADDLVRSAVLLLGEGLVPHDAPEQWSQWTLFTTTIPTARQAAAKLTGVPGPAVTVRPDPSLHADEYRLVVEGGTSCAGAVDDPALPYADRTVADCTHARGWSQIEAALTQGLAKAAAVAFTPEQLSIQLQEWSTSDDGAALARAVEDELTLADRVTLWAAIRDGLAVATALPEVSVVLTWVRERIAGAA